MSQRLEVDQLALSQTGPCVDAPRYALPVRPAQLSCADASGQHASPRDWPGLERLRYWLAREHRRSSSRPVPAPPTHAVNDPRLLRFCCFRACSRVRNVEPVAARERFTVGRDPYPVTQARRLDMSPQTRPRDRAVVERLEVDCNDGGSRNGASGGDHVPLVHHDVVALKKASAAGVDDDHLGTLFIERRLHLGTPDAVTHHVQSRFIGGPQDKPADLAHLATDLAGAVAAASAHDGDAMDLGPRLYGAHVTESTPNQACG